MRNNAHNTDDDVLIRAEHVSKKFCRSLKRSLWYGAQDVANSLMPWKRSLERIGIGEKLGEPELRPEEFWAVRDVSFEVRRGECLGLIGHNGAGKSTLLKILNSLIRPDSGRITMKGRVGALIELSAGFNPILTGRENIYNQAALLGFSNKEIESRFDAIVDFSELEEFLDTPVQNYSSGMRVRLGFAIAAQMEPDILIIDEVLAVGDVGFRFKCINAMAKLMNRAAVIFVSHTMPQILRVSNKVMHLENGGVSYHGDDVAKGVGDYYKRLAGQAPTVVGTGDVELEQIRLATGSRPAEQSADVEIQHGESVILELALKVDPQLPSIVVQVLFWNMEMLPVLDVLGPGLGGFPIINNPSGRHFIRLKLDNISLNSGMHYLSVIASSPDLSVHYLRHDNAAVVRVSAATPSGAQTVVSGQWRVIEAI